MLENKRTRVSYTPEFRNILHESHQMIGAVYDMMRAKRTETPAPVVEQPLFEEERDWAQAAFIVACIAAVASGASLIILLMRG